MVKWARMGQVFFYLSGIVYLLPIGVPAGLGRRSSRSSLNFVFSLLVMRCACYFGCQGRFTKLLFFGKTSNFILKYSMFEKMFLGCLGSVSPLLHEKLRFTFGAVSKPETTNTHETFDDCNNPEEMALTLYS